MPESGQKERSVKPSALRLRWFKSNFSHHFKDKRNSPTAGAAGLPIVTPAETVGEAPCFLQKRGAFSFWGGKNGGVPVYWIKLFVDRAARMDGPAFDVQLTCVKKKGNGR